MGAARASERRAILECAEDCGRGTAFFDEVGGRLHDFFENGDRALLLTVIGFGAAVVDVRCDVGMRGPRLEGALIEVRVGEFFGEGREVFVEGEVAREAVAVLSGECGERSCGRGSHMEEHTTRRGECKGVWGCGRETSAQKWS
jgi:hypothetical protein